MRRIPLLAVSMLLLCNHASAEEKKSSAMPEELLAKSKEPLIRETAAQVLGLRGNDQSVPLLALALAQDPNLWVRSRCAEALGNIGSPSAIPPLRTALTNEKDQRVRRMIGLALARHGQSSGVKELMWQLTSGTNYTKAEVMQSLVVLTGQPLGQNVEAWWRYLDPDGQTLLARRPGGHPALLELRGAQAKGGQARRGPFLYAGTSPTWQQVPAVVISLEPNLSPLTSGILQRYEKEHGVIPDHCLLMIHTRWREAKPPTKSKEQTSPKSRMDTAGPPEHLELGMHVDAARYLLKVAPHLVGVGIDAPTIDAQGAPRPAARDLLLNAGKLVLESVDDLDRLQPYSTRLLVISLGRPLETNPFRVLLLAVLP
jgi:kynurenine formamidase